MKIQNSILVSVLFISVLCFSLACGAQQNSNTANVAAEEPQVASTQAEADVAYQVLSETSYVSWIGSKVLGKHNGKFPVQAGEFFLNTEGVSSGSVVIDISGVVVEDLEGKEAEDLSTHLLSEDFFDTQQYPTATFEVVSTTPFDSTAFVDTEEYESPNKPLSSSAFRVENPTHNITGNLTIKNVTKSINFPAQVIADGENVTIKAKFNINRQDWGIAYGDENSVVDKAKDKFIYNTVNVGFELYASSSPQETIEKK